MLVAAPRTLFLTGVTGFVGAALAVELLRVNRRDKLICLVRAASDDEAARRLRRALNQAASAYGADGHELDELMQRAVAVRGDLTEPHLGISDGDRAVLRLAAPLHVFHCAASLKDSEESLHEILAHNVVGTERVLETLLPLNVAIFNHVSTAYVAGRRTGPVEESLDRPRGFSNRYEQSKFYGEMLVVDHCRRAGIPFRILRPSVVIAHSQTALATGYTGFLGWVLKVSALNEMSGGILTRQPLRYMARGDADLNVVPIDAVVEDIVGIDAAGDATHDRAFHLTNAMPPRVDWLAQVSAEALGLRGVECVDAEDGLDPVSARFHRWTRFERPYVHAPKTFLRDSNALYTSPRHGRTPITADLMRRMIVCAIADTSRPQAQPQAQKKREGAA